MDGVDNAGERVYRLSGDIPLCEKCGLPKIGPVGGEPVCRCASDIMQQVFLQGYSAARQPFCCPVCGGRGLVATNFYTANSYSTSTEPESCRSCSGTGIVWG